MKLKERMLNQYDVLWPIVAELLSTSINSLGRMMKT